MFLNELSSESLTDRDVRAAEPREMGYVWGGARIYPDQGGYHPAG